MKKIIPLITDEPVDLDGGLELDSYADALAGIASGTEGPFVVGIYGHWGTGKTSLMKIAKKKLDEEAKDYLTVWFDAWQYQKSDEILVPFFESIICAVESNESFKKGEKLTNALKGIISGLSFNLGVVQFNAETALKKEDELNEHLQDFYTRYFKSLGDLETSLDENKKIVIFIDDLDRCSPKKVLQILETIKLVLNQKRFIFFLGMAPNLFEDYIESVYREEFKVKESHLKSQNYLDKIVQLPFNIPSHEKNLENFFEKLAEKVGKGSGDKKLKNELLEAKPLFILICEKNPRKLIRLINTTILTKHLSNKYNIDLFYFVVSSLLSTEKDFRDSITSLERDSLHFTLLDWMFQEDAKKYREYEKSIDLDLIKIKKALDEKLKEKKNNEQELETAKKLIESEPELHRLIFKKEFTVYFRKWLLNECEREESFRYAEVSKQEDIPDEKGKKINENNVNIDKQEQKYLKLIEKNPNDSDAYLMYANHLYTINRFEEAIEIYSKAIELKPDYAGAYSNRGTAWSNKTEYDKAIADYNKAIELKPDEAVAYSNRGNAWSNKAEYDKAIADYNKAIELKPDDAVAYSNRGNAWSNKTEYDKAIADYNKAIELKPDYAGAYSNRGTAWSNKTEYDKAIADYNKAIELKPDDAVAYSNRGITWSKKTEYDEAINDYNKAIELKPDDAVAYSNRGITWSKKTEYDEAINDYNKAIELKPDDAIAYGNLAGLFFYLDRNMQYANVYLKKAYELANPQTEKPLLLELEFYKYAHSDDAVVRKEALQKINELLDRGGRSPGFIMLLKNCEKAIEKGHPDPENLKKIAQKIIEIEKSD